MIDDQIQRKNRRFFPFSVADVGEKSSKMSSDVEMDSDDFDDFDYYNTGRGFNSVQPTDRQKKRITCNFIKLPTTLSTTCSN